jgi:hypothetical protein
MKGYIKYDCELTAVLGVDALVNTPIPEQASAAMRCLESVVKRLKPCSRR